MNPGSPQALLARELAPDEKLLWSGRPKQGLVFRASDAFLLFFGLLWCGFLLFWLKMVSDRDAPPIFKVFGFAMLSFGLAMTAGRCRTTSNDGVSVGGRVTGDPQSTDRMAAPRTPARRRRRRVTLRASPDPHGAATGRAARPRRLPWPRAR